MFAKPSVFMPLFGHIWSSVVFDLPSLSCPGISLSIKTHLSQFCLVQLSALAPVHLLTSALVCLVLDVFQVFVLFV